MTWSRIVSLLLPVACFGLHMPALGQPTSLDSLRHYDVQPLGSYSAIWGYTAPDGREYAVLGVNGSSGGTPYPGGTSIIDITNVGAVQQVAFIGGPNSQWREMKTFRHYAYVVSEGGGGVQIINLSQLPDTAWLVKSFNYVSAGKNTLRSHSISIHDGFMYLNGCANWSPGGILIFDLRTDPENPVFVGQYQPDYVHDSYVLRDTMYASAIYSGGGLYIADATDKSNIQTIGLISYTGSGTHNAWVTKDRSHVLTTDEIGSPTQKNLKFWNISNLPAIPGSPAATYTPSPGEIVHNVTVRGDYAYVAWYTAGLRVVNISNPASPANAGGFDTSPLTSGYNGVWGVYPYFPSGKIIAGDIQNGLWVFSFSDLAPRQPVQLLAPANASVVYDSVALTLRWTRAADLSKDPHYYTIVITGPGVNLSVNVNDSLYTLGNFAGFQSGETYQWHVRTRDEFNDTASPDTFSFQYTQVPPAAPLQLLPTNASQNQPVSLPLKWFGALGAASYRVQVATDSIFANIVEDSTADDTIVVFGPLSHDTPYYWRVRGENSVGSGGWSIVWSFLTAPSPPFPPALLAPSDGVTGEPTTPAFAWSSSSGATSYRFQLSTDSLFGSFITNAEGLSDSVYVSDTLMNLTAYYWRVSGTNAGGEGAFSIPWKFTTVIAVPGTPNLVAPLNGAASLPTSVSLRWNVANASQRYRVQLSQDSLFSAVTFEDSTLTDTVVVAASLVPGAQYFWRVRGENDVWVGVWSEVRAFSVSTQVTGQYTVLDGWNLVSLPLVVPDSSATGVYPQAVSSLYGFSPSGGYVAFQVLQPGLGYWLKFADSTDIKISGGVRYADTVEVHTGWNLIGALSEPVQVNGIVEIPPGIVASDFFGYNGAYVVADTLLPGKAYWIKSGKQGLLVLSASPSNVEVPGRRDVDAEERTVQPEGTME